LSSYTIKLLMPGKDRGYVAYQTTYSWSVICRQLAVSRWLIVLDFTRNM